jgi:hypothetical protein
VLPAIKATIPCISPEFRPKFALIASSWRSLGIGLGVAMNDFVAVFLV